MNMHALHSSLAFLFLAVSSANCMQDEEPAAAPAQVRAPLPGEEEIAKLPADGGPEFNRLIFEQSPYLLQHARNPVDWFPWGDEAFELARKLDKPVFLSVGYSTCHWCHVMEHESFEDEEVAALMNAEFVCIKVDREERPDLDHAYMAVTQSMTGRGGWPMTVFMTPERIPFYTGTYFPKETRFGRPGMLEIVPRIGQLWRDQRAEVMQQANQVKLLLSNLGRGNPGGELGAEVLGLAFRQLSGRFDSANGGFGQSPKFPVPHDLLFLLQYHQRTQKPKALQMVKMTLGALHAGGIFDQVGFGFHRYSTDAHWLVPHFEKMLYDQALLIMAYTAAWQVTDEEGLRRTAEQVIEYILRDMTAPEGGFYSAEDADSEGEEGLFYLWTLEEVRAVLGDEDAPIWATALNIKADGNFVDEATGQSSGANIPHFTKGLPALSRELGIGLDELRESLERSRRKLFLVREERIHPLKDDKILTDWNGLMIAALARAGRAFDDSDITQAARRAADFALSTLRTSEGRLYKRYRQGRPGLPGTLEDYAFLSWGLIELYETTFEVRYLEAAIEITDTMIARFGDEERGGFFLSADDMTDLVGRGKEAYDGALPAGQSAAAWNLLRLARITGRTDFEKEAQGAMGTHSKAVASRPSSHTLLLQAVDFAVGPSYEIVVAGDLEQTDTHAMLRAFQSRYLPNKVLLHRPPGATPAITELAEFTLHQREQDGKATAYVCREYACREPTTDIDAALEYLDPESWE